MGGRRVSEGKEQWRRICHHPFLKRRKEKAGKREGRRRQHTFSNLLRSRMARRLYSVSPPLPLNCWSSPAAETQVLEERRRARAVEETREDRP